MGQPTIIVVVVLYMLAMLYIGYMFKTKSATATGFLTGNRSIAHGLVESH